jgi:hypothetical protein
MAPRLLEALGNEIIAFIVEIEYRRIDLMRAEKILQVGILVSNENSSSNAP